MKTPKTETRPEIDWERGDLYDTMDHEELYQAIGESPDGKQFMATWVEVDGEFGDIIDIEEL